MIHVFLLLVYVGVGSNRTLVSDDMCFRSIHYCNYFAEHLAKRYGYRTNPKQDLGVAYCVPKHVYPQEVKIY